MGILANALPGFRDLRSPLIAGYLWLLFGWLLIDPDLSRENARGVLASVLDLSDTVGPVATTTAISVAAYFLGAVSRDLSSMLSRLPRTRRRDMKQRLPLWAALQRSNATVFAPQSDEDSAIVAIGNEIAQRIAEARDGLAALEPALGVLAHEEDALWAAHRSLHKAVDELQETVERDLNRDLDFPATLLLGRDPETFAEADRIRAESELRLAATPPLAALAILLTAKVGLFDGLLWLLALVPIGALFLQGISKDEDARKFIAGAILYRKGESTALKRLDGSLERIGADRARLATQLDDAEAGLRHDDEAGDGAAAVRLGALLEARHQPSEARAAFSRADGRGHPEGSVQLGAALERVDDLDGACAAYRRADERGHPEGAVRLGAVLERLGDLDGARTAYERAAVQGHPDGELHLGAVLDQLDDLDGARAAYARAEARGHPEGAIRLGDVLERLEDSDGALDAYQRAELQGHPDGAFKHGWLLDRQGEHDAALEAYRRGAEDDQASAYKIATIHESYGLPGTQDAFERAMIGELDLEGIGDRLGALGDTEAAKHAFDRALKQGDLWAGFKLGALLEEEGDADGARDVFLRAHRISSR